MLKSLTVSVLICAVFLFSVEAIFRALNYVPKYHREIRSAILGERVSQTTLCPVNLQFDAEGFRRANFSQVERVTLKAMDQKKFNEGKVRVALLGGELMFGSSRNDWETIGNWLFIEKPDTIRVRIYAHPEKSLRDQGKLFFEQQQELGFHHLVILPELTQVNVSPIRDDQTLKLSELLLIQLSRSVLAHFIVEPYVKFRYPRDSLSSQQSLGQDDLQILLSEASKIPNLQVTLLQSKLIKSELFSGIQENSSVADLVHLPEEIGEDSKVLADLWESSPCTGYSRLGTYRWSQELLKKWKLL